MTEIRSVLFNIYFFGELAVCMVAMFFCLPLPRPALEAVIRAWAKSACWGMRVIAGIDYEIRGIENIPDEPAIFASKHQSMWETVSFWWIFRAPVYVMKKELRSIPFWGWYARKCQQVFVDRSGGASALKKMVRDSLEALTTDRHLVIFPEGTRAMPGKKLVYHPGVAALYTRTSSRVVPVALNSGVFWGRRQFLKKPGTIVIEFLPPMELGLTRKEFARELEDRIEAATDRLVAEANGSLKNR
ncbi:MAG: 1-acyl-sn-glycerol-3-phosphate acyltransferase [Alphaproteobacteria bacterium]|nr:1-acyl-sn-glycerol-3-phosphate acyltransferase [Alphaproteobacteria bacterium]